MLHRGRGADARRLLQHAGAGTGNRARTTGRSAAGGAKRSAVSTAGRGGCASRDLYRKTRRHAIQHRARPGPGLQGTRCLEQSGQPWRPASRPAVAPEAAASLAGSNRDGESGDFIWAGRDAPAGRAGAGRPGIRSASAGCGYRGASARRGYRGTSARRGFRGTSVACRVGAASTGRGISTASAARGGVDQVRAPGAQAAILA